MKGLLNTSNRVTPGKETDSCCFISRWHRIVRVSLVLNKTVVDSDSRFENLAIDIFGVKVNCITSFDGIKLWLLIWMGNNQEMLLLVVVHGVFFTAMNAGTPTHSLLGFAPSARNIMFYYCVIQIQTHAFGVFEKNWAKSSISFCVY